MNYKQWTPEAALEAAAAMLEPKHPDLATSIRHVPKLGWIEGALRGVAYDMAKAREEWHEKKEFIDREFHRTWQAGEIWSAAVVLYVNDNVSPNPLESVRKFQSVRIDKAIAAFDGSKEEKVI